jgi:hypothetical protein
MSTYDKDSSLQFYLKFGHLNIKYQYVKIQNLTNMTLGSISISNPHIQARKHIGLRGGN